MAKRHRPSSHVAKVAVASLFIAGGAVAAAGHAAAEPDVPVVPTPVPGEAPATPAPGQPVVEKSDEPVGPPPPPPVGAPPVPEINPVYGQGQTPGQFGYIRDLWHAFHSGNPIEALTMPPGVAPGPPPGAGPPPPLPPGHISLTAPQSSTPPLSAPGMPAEVPPPPGAPVAPPAPGSPVAPAPAVVPIAPTP